jgi:thiosulfate/3-mercaptopyruvate sulfurtransferase
MEKKMSDKGYANADLAWSPDALKQKLGDESLCIVDTRPLHDYAEGHIMGALHWDLYSLSLNDTRPQAFDAFMAMLVGVIRNQGIRSDATVVFYEDNTGMRCGRGFWICEYFGHPDVHVLDGGFQAWNKAGYPVTTEIPRVEAGWFTAEPVAERNITSDELNGSLGKDGFAVLDTRSDGEYYGETVRAKRGGAIPGAVHIEYVNNMDETGALKPAAELKEMYEAVGITADKEIACYCQGGYRSANSYLALRLLGYPTVKNYVGSWREWGDREDLPIEKPSR